MNEKQGPGGRKASVSFAYFIRTGGAAAANSQRPDDFPPELPKTEGDMVADATDATSAAEASDEDQPLLKQQKRRHDKKPSFGRRVRQGVMDLTYAEAAGRPERALPAGVIAVGQTVSHSSASRGSSAAEPMEEQHHEARSASGRSAPGQPKGRGSRVTIADPEVQEGEVRHRLPHSRSEAIAAAAADEASELPAATPFGAQTAQRSAKPADRQGFPFRLLNKSAFPFD